MEQNISPPTAARFKSIPFSMGIAFISVSLIYLMAFPIHYHLGALVLNIAIAILLSFMIEEDAHEQTVDLYRLAFLAILMFLFSLVYNQSQRFIIHTITGLCLFRCLLTAISLCLTFRSFPDTILSDSCEEADDSNNNLIGYLPIFMLVFVFSLGFGENFAPFVFTEANFVVEVITELLDFYPVFLYFFLIGWIFLEGISWWLEYVKGHQILWAFGGGDVIFLGLFAGYLGLASLLGLFFLSLIARLVFSLLQFLLN